MKTEKQITLLINAVRLATEHLDNKIDAAAIAALELALPQRQDEKGKIIPGYGHGNLTKIRELLTVLESPKLVLYRDGLLHYIADFYPCFRITKGIIEHAPRVKGVIIDGKTVKFMNPEEFRVVTDLMPSNYTRVITALQQEKRQAASKKAAETRAKKTTDATAAVEKAANLERENTALRQQLAELRAQPAAEKLKEKLAAQLKAANNLQAQYSAVKAELSALKEKEGKQKDNLESLKLALLAERKENQRLQAVLDHLGAPQTIAA